MGTERPQWSETGESLNYVFSFFHKIVLYVTIFLFLKLIRVLSVEYFWKTTTMNLILLISLRVQHIYIESIVFPKETIEMPH